MCGKKERRDAPNVSSRIPTMPYTITSAGEAHGIAGETREVEAEGAGVLRTVSMSVLRVSM